MPSDSTDEAMRVALYGICAAPVCGVAMAIGGILGVTWLMLAGGIGLLGVALLGPILAFADIMEAMRDD